MVRRLPTQTLFCESQLFLESANLTIIETAPQVSPISFRTKPRPLKQLGGLSRTYRCRCRRIVFFGNSRCLACRAELGYEPHLGKLFALTPAQESETWQLVGLRSAHVCLYRRCANLESSAGCNWVVRVNADAQPQKFCISCRLNRTIPDLSVPGNGELWGRIEVAKRRVISSLVALRLPVASRLTEDPDHGLAFDLLSPAAPGDSVMTGHSGGIITLNIEEADDARREEIRAAMHEVYRTLVGHFRHELGHYYWYRLLEGSKWLSDFRDLFGAETTDYALALKAYHEQGPPSDWQTRFISSYASSHPWEDWAETWAHYMHMVDALGTAASFGLKTTQSNFQFEPFAKEALYRPDASDASEFLRFLNAWVELTAVVNELSRSMGQPDFYPFVLPYQVISKLQFVHTMVRLV
jgi:hypothetical protein